MSFLKDIAKKAQATVSTGGLNIVDDLTGGNVRREVEGVLDTVTGKDAQDAAKEAADIQARAALAQAEATKEATAMAVGEQREAREQARADLDPFRLFGQGFMGTASDAITGSQELFNNPMSIMQNPMFQAIQEDTRRRVMQNAAVGGRLGTGGTVEALETSALRTGFDVLNSERNTMLNNARFMADIVGMGQNAAAGQGSASLDSGTNISNAISQGNQVAGNLATSAANAKAAGIVGAANAQQQGFMNIADLGATIVGAA